MPNCSKCSNSQAKLNKGALCKPCFQKKIHKVLDSSITSLDDDIINTEDLHERDLINLIKDNMAQEKMFNTEIVTILKEQITHMKTEITHKNSLIESLMTELYYRNNDDSNSSNLSNEHTSSTKLSSTTISDHHKDDDKANDTDDKVEWQTVNNGRKEIVTSEDNGLITLNNRFDGLPIQECPIDDNLAETELQQNVSMIKRSDTDNIVISKSNVYVNKKNFNDLPLKNVIVNSPKRKILILSASITKPINMVQFNNLLINGHAVKRAYGGATTTRLMHYVKGDLSLDNPDTIIINGGTNNFTKTIYSDKEIAEDIFQIVDICRQSGVKNIFVSSITCRPEFQQRVDDINSLLKENSIRYNYVFINNVFIQEPHLKRDKLHLNQQGVNILANNFLYHLNRPYLTLPFTSIWD